MRVTCKKNWRFPSQFIKSTPGVNGHTTRAPPGVSHTRANLEPGTSGFSTLRINHYATRGGACIEPVEAEKRHRTSQRGALRGAGPVRGPETLAGCSLDQIPSESHAYIAARYRSGHARVLRGLTRANPHAHVREWVGACECMRACVRVALLSVCVRQSQFVIV